jgi:hypothetical protein
MLGADMDNAKLTERDMGSISPLKLEFEMEKHKMLDTMKSN